MTYNTRITYMNDIKQLTLHPRQLSFEMLRDIYEQPVILTLPESAYEAIDASHEDVRTIIARDKSAYGINTGFGLLAKPTGWRSQNY